MIWNALYRFTAALAVGVACYMAWVNDPSMARFGWALFAYATVPEIFRTWTLPSYFHPATPTVLKGVPHSDPPDDPKDLCPIIPDEEDFGAIKLYTGRSDLNALNVPPEVEAVAVIGGTPYDIEFLREIVAAADRVCKIDLPKPLDGRSVCRT